MLSRPALLTLSFGAAITLGQLVGTYQTETHPKLPFQRCTKSGGCIDVSEGQIVLDANWRWTHHKDSSTNCYTGNTWDTSVCPDGKTCAANCAVDGADYTGNYGISVAGNALTLKFVTNNSNGKNIGSRVYLMNSDSQYELFKVLNQEFTFDVDVSNLPCGLNGALYFSEMDADGGLAKFPGNKAGAKYGTGYCDSQCPKDIKFINGEVRFCFRFTSTFYSFRFSFFLSYSRPTWKGGRLLRLIPTAELATTEHAATKWTSGKPTAYPRPIPLIPAPSKVNTAAAVLNAIPPPIVTPASATPTAATSTPTAWAIQLSSVPSSQSIPRRR